MKQFRTTHNITKIYQKLNESPDPIERLEQMRQGSFGVLGFSVIVFFIGGPENIIVPSEFRGTWYHPTTCQTFDVGFRGGSAENWWYHSKQEQYDSLVSKEKSDFFQDWSYEHPYRTDSVQKEIAEIRKVMQDNDSTRLRLLSDKNDNTWKSFALDLPLSGGLIDEDPYDDGILKVIEYEEFTLFDQEQDAELRVSTDMKKLMFLFNDEEKVFTFVSEKPETCVGDPIAHATEQIPLLTQKLNDSKKNIENLILQDKEVRSKSGSNAVVSLYPHPCDNVDPDLHVKVSGDASLCFPKNIDNLLSTLETIGKETYVPDGFSDSLDFGVFIKPLNCEKNKWSTSYSYTCDEKSDLSSTALKALKTKAQNTMYKMDLYESNCEKKYIDEKEERKAIT